MGLEASLSLFKSTSVHCLMAPFSICSVVCNILVLLFTVWCIMFGWGLFRSLLFRREIDIFLKSFQNISSVTFLFVLARSRNFVSQFCFVLLVVLFGRSVNVVELDRF